MPILVHCDCGATFDVDDRYAGRQGHCFECGCSVAVPDPAVDQEDAGEIPLAPMYGSDAQSDAVRRPPVDRLLSGAESAAPAGPAAPSPPSDTPVQTVYRHTSDRDAILAPEFGFWRDALRSFYMFLDPDNLFACLFIWILHMFIGALSYATTQTQGAVIWVLPLLCLLFQLLLVGWLCGFYLNIILETARGEDTLPPLAAEGDPWNDMLRPLSLFVGSWLAVLLPAGLCLAPGPLAVDRWILSLCSVWPLWACSFGRAPS